MRINSIRKDYGTISKILTYNKAIEVSPPQCDPHGKSACVECWPRSKNPTPSQSSLQRSKTLITDYTLANQFDLFTTFTFDPKKVDSLDIALAKSKMSKWLNNARRHSPDLIYLIVPELHKSGRIHFHALMKNYNGILTPSYTKSGRIRTSKGRVVFDIGQYHWGFSTAVRIDNVEKVSSYMQKYVTKDMLKIGNKKRFWVSKGLNKPIKTYNVNMWDEVTKKPLFVLDVYSHEYYKIYKILNTPIGVDQKIVGVSHSSRKHFSAHNEIQKITWDNRKIPTS